MWHIVLQMWHVQVKSMCIYFQSFYLIRPESSGRAIAIVRWRQSVVCAPKMLLPHFLIYINVCFIGYGL